MSEDKPRMGGALAVLLVAAAAILSLVWYAEHRHAEDVRRADREWEESMSSALRRK